MIFNGVLWSFPGSWRLEWSTCGVGHGANTSTMTSLDESLSFRCRSWWYFDKRFSSAAQDCLLIALLVLYFTELAVHGLRGNEAPLFCIFVFSSWILLAIRSTPHSNINKSRWALLACVDFISLKGLNKLVYQRLFKVLSADVFWHVCSM